ncbi:MAG TPA: hypothetical protein VG943_10200 [Caulobacterales bacterium]|nr:hypothetical protein [Caulobacterales bacterium]
MQFDFGGVAWLIAVAGGAAALAVALIVGGAMWLARDRSQDAQAERSTRREYDEEDEAPQPKSHDEPVS